MTDPSEYERLQRAAISAARAEGRAPFPDDGPANMATCEALIELDAWVARMVAERDRYRDMVEFIEGRCTALYRDDNFDDGRRWSVELHRTDDVAGFGETVDEALDAARALESPDTPAAGEVEHGD